MALFLKIFVECWGLCAAVVALQVISAGRDGFLTQRQMRSRGIYVGYSLLQHAGVMWADLTIIPLILATIIYRCPYPDSYFSKQSLWVGALAAGLTAASLFVYENNSVEVPEAHAHDGRTSVTGWIHGLFAWLVTWRLGLFFVGTPGVTSSDLSLINFLLIVFFFLGVVKFSRDWKFSKQDGYQVMGLTFLVVIMASARVALMHH